MYLLLKIKKKDGTDSFSRNVGKKLPLLACVMTQKSTVLTCFSISDNTLAVQLLAKADSCLSNVSICWGSLLLSYDLEVVLGSSLTLVSVQNIISSYVTDRLPFSGTSQNHSTSAAVHSGSEVVCCIFLGAPSAVPLH